MANELKGQLGELRFTVTVVRKDTGKVETFEMFGVVDAEQPKEIDGDANCP